MTARRFAEDTKVTVERSQQELKGLLKRAGADEIAVYEAALRSMVAFKLGAFFYRLTAPIPAKAKNKEQEERRVWRLLVLLVKAKLEAVREGASTIEREFLADMAVSPSETVADRVMPELAAARAEGRLPRTLLIEGPR